ncbi:caspase-3 [Athalia rosae]|uniref:caspase-3 n=1 Tax=Athalia rosae TaxID=37344 RepID=UPI002033EAD5|nr:caspase-3 [Athalia rosae]
MNTEDCDRITNNCARLVPEINWPQIFPKLLEHKIFRLEDKNVMRWKENLDNIDNNREMYLRIKSRGPNAFNSLVRCLEEVGRDDLANILKPSNTNDQVDNDIGEMIHEMNGNIEDSIDTMTPVEYSNEVQDDYYRKLQITEVPLTVQVIKSKKFYDNFVDKVMCYDMRTEPRGLVLIINNISFPHREEGRQGAEHDEKNLKDLFLQMGFEVIPKRNKTSHEIQEILKTFSQNPKLRHVSSMFVIVMSHGGQKIDSDSRTTDSDSVVFGTDERTIPVSKILNLFTATSCENMCRKPKIFIFQTCRGDKTQQLVNATTVPMGRCSSDAGQSVESKPPAVPAGYRDFSDMLVAYSTLPGFEANRDKLTGSWYIQAFCEVMMNHAHDTELSRLLQMTDDRLAWMNDKYHGCQTSVFMNYGFNKQCFLNPGFFTRETDT